MVVVAGAVRVRALGKAMVAGHPAARASEFGAAMVAGHPAAKGVAEAGENCHLVLVPEELPAP